MPEIRFVDNVRFVAYIFTISHRFSVINLSESFTELVVVALEIDGDVN